MLVQVLQLLSELLVLSHVLLGLLNADAIVLGNRVELCQAIAQLFQLVDLLVSQLFSFLVLLFQLRELLGQVRQALRRILHLLEHVRLALFDQVVELLLSSELVDFELALELLLLLDLFLGCLEVTLQVQQEIWLLDHLEAPLEFIVLLH